MKFEVDLDTEQITQSISDTVVRNAVNELENDIFDEGHYNFARRMYRDNVQGEVRKLIKAHSDEIIEKAIKEASLIIARKALPKLLEKELG